jgi:SAM-dependent methyltransferase
MGHYPSVAGVLLPPQDMLFMDKTAGAGLEHGKKLITLIQQRAGIGNGQFLDIGCGWGRAAYGLLNAGFDGRYVGFDVLPDQIDWLRANFSTIHPRYRFEKTHIKNAFEKDDAGDVSADVASLCDGPLGIAIALSIFTHLYDKTVAGYMQKVFNLLAPGRPFVFTAFLLNDESESLVNAGKGYFKPTHRLNNHCSIQDPSNPRHVIAYSEKWLVDLVERQGYIIDRVYYGNWCGRDTTTYPDGQDWVVLRRPS